MIRLFLNLCKCFHQIKKFSEIEILNHLQKDLFNETGSCPFCGAPMEALHKDGHYERDFICYESGAPVYHHITVYCVECSSCRHSHAIEPSVIVPYSSFSLGFLLNVTYAKLTKRFPTIEKFCNHFDISVSTYYRVYKRFLTDSVLLKQLSKLSDILSVWKNTSDEFHHIFFLFFDDCGRSFLQPCVRLRPNIHLKGIHPDVTQYIDNGIGNQSVVCSLRR